MGVLSDLNRFVNYARKDAWNTLKEDPERIFIGAIDPASSWAWGKITGKDYKPVINQLGSPMGGGDLGLNKSGGQYKSASEAGIDPSRGQTFFGVGDTIAGFYGGSAAAGALGGGGQAAAGGGGLGSGASVAPEAGLLASGSEATAAGAGAGYSSAAPTVAAEFAPVAQSVGTPAATTGGTGASGLIQQGQGLLSSPQEQQQQAQPMYPTQAPDPQKQQQQRLKLLQNVQLQQLRMKPNKTVEDIIELQRAEKQQGLLA